MATQSSSTASMLPGTPSLSGMPTERFWTHRLRWRVKGAWQWPAFAIATAIDTLVLWQLPPSFLTGYAVWAFFMAMFGNLVLVGAITPFLARRLHARDPDLRPYEVTHDRVAVFALVAGMAGCLAFGLGNRDTIVAETDAKERAAEAIRAEVENNGSKEMLRNVDASDTVRVGKDYFRICIPMDDRTKAFCWYVDGSKNPAEVRRDKSVSTNRRLFPEGR